MTGKQIEDKIRQEQRIDTLADREEVNIVEMGKAFSAISGLVYSANALLKEFQDERDTLQRIRERLVIWLSNADELDVLLTPAMAKSAKELLDATATTLQRKYYSLGESFVSIDVKAEIENVIPY